ncbi:Isonitrile hydratase [compost metagenome]
MMIRAILFLTTFPITMMVLAQEKIKIGVFIYPEMELQDFAGPTDVFVKANRYTDDQYELLLFSEDGEAIQTERKSVNLVPDYSFVNLPKVNMIVVPGAPVAIAKELAQKSEVANFLGFQSQSGTTMCSVCTGAYFLAYAGILDGHKFTTHYLDAQDIAKEFPKAEIIANVRFVDSNQVLTASGITSGIDLGLYIVEKFSGKEVQHKVSHLMQYDYQENQQWPE